MNNVEMGKLAVKLEKLLKEDKIDFVRGSSYSDKDVWTCKLDKSNYAFRLEVKATESVLYLLSDPLEKLKETTPACCCGSSFLQEVTARDYRIAAARNNNKISHVSKLLDQL